MRRAIHVSNGKSNTNLVMLLCYRITTGGRRQTSLVLVLDCTLSVGTLKTRTRRRVENKNGKKQNGNVKTLKKNLMYVWSAEKCYKSGDSSQNCLIAVLWFEWIRCNESGNIVKKQWNIFLCEEKNSYYWTDFSWDSENSKTEIWIKTGEI